MTMQADRFPRQSSANEGVPIGSANAARSVASGSSSGDFCFVPRGETFSYINSSSESASLVLAHAPSFELSEEEFLE